MLYVALTEPPVIPQVSHERNDYSCWQDCGYANASASQSSEATHSPSAPDTHPPPPQTPQLRRSAMPSLRRRPTHPPRQQYFGRLHLVLSDVTCL